MIAVAAKCRRLLMLAAVAVLLAPGPAAAQDGGAAILEARIADQGAETRIVLELTRPREFRLAAEAAAPRITVDFRDTIWAAVPPALPAGQVADLTSRSPDGGGLQIAVDLTGPATVEDVFYLPSAGGGSYRFVLDLAPATADDYARLVANPIVGELLRPAAASGASGDLSQGGAGAGAPGLTGAVPLPPRRPAARRNVIAIDAGHGGHDPGAVGINGELEKDITLAVALRLADTLAASGRYDVVLTRDDDTFLRLAERVQVARQAGAHLFLSLHADSIEDNAGLTGASLYTLSETASDREAARLAERENAADALAGVALDPEDDVTTSILLDLAHRLTRNESFMAAEILAQTLGQSVVLLPTRPHRQADFVVLRAPDVPSVLIEMGYLSNADEEALLAGEAHQVLLTDAIMAGIDRYFAWVATLSRS